MKKSLIYILAVVAGLYSCDPYKDLNKSMQDDLVLQRDNDAIPTSIIIGSDEHVFFSVLEAQDSIPKHLKNTYQANVLTDGKLIEVEYTVEAKNMTPKTFMTDADYAIAGNEFCKEEDGWLINSDISFDESDSQISLEQEDFTFIGFQYPNFSSSDYDEDAYKGYTYSSKLEAMISDILANHRKLDRSKSIAVTFDVYKEGLDTLVFSAGTLKGCAYHFLPSDNIDEKISLIFNSKYPDQLMKSQSAAVYKVGEIGGEITEFENFFQKGETSSWATISEEDLVHQYYTLTEEDYNSMGFSYPNFSSSSAPENYLPQFLSISLPYTQENTTLRVKYNYYGSGQTLEHIQEYLFTEGAWNLVAPYVMETESMSKFKYNHSETAWKLSEAALIELNTEDYAVTGDDKYNNFGYYDDVEGEYPEGTPVDNILDAKINDILKTNYPDLNVADQEVTVSYQYYDNGTNTVSRNYIYNASTSNWDRQ